MPRARVDAAFQLVSVQLPHRAQQGGVVNGMPQDYGRDIGPQLPSQSQELIRLLVEKPGHS